MAGGVTTTKDGNGRAGPAGDPASPSSDHPPDLPPPVRPGNPRTRHCFVEHADGRGATPALLLDWEQREDGWWGLVVLARVDDDAVITVSRWIEQERLSRG